MKKSPSPAQIVANQANAKKSTGPKTRAGRDVSKMNALKHGILSKEVVVHGSWINESDEEFAALHQRLWDELVPAGSLEEMLVDQIVTAHWRLRRALKAESGEIALNVGGGHRKHNSSAVIEEMIEQWECSDDILAEMRDSVFGNSFMEDQLQAVCASVELTGELTEAAINKVNFRGELFELTEHLHEVRNNLQANPDGLTIIAPAGEEKRSKRWLTLMRNCAFVLENKATREEREKMQEEAQQAAALLPDPAVLEKILRYETKLERQLFRAINQLERLQRMRQGEAVPPPLTMEVSEIG